MPSTLLCAVQVWDIGSGRLLRDLPGHTNRITGIEFHPFEFIMASSSADRTVRVWDLETWDPLQTLGPEAVPVKGLVFHKDGRELISATQDCVRVWGWENGVQQDSIQVDWPRLADMSLTDNRITGCTFNLSAVGVFVVDIRHLKPWAKHTAAAAAEGTSSAHGSARQQQQLPPAVGSSGRPNAGISANSAAAAVAAMSLGSMPEQAAHILAAAPSAAAARQATPSAAASKAASLAPSAAASVAVSRRTSFNQPAIEQHQSTTPSRRTSTQHLDTPTVQQQQQQEQRRQSVNEASSRSTSATRARPAGSAGAGGGLPNGALRPGQLAATGGGGEQYVQQQQQLKFHDGSSKGRLSVGPGGGGYFPDMELRVPAGGQPAGRVDYQGSVGSRRESVDQAAAAAAPDGGRGAGASSRERMAGPSGRNPSPMTRSEGPSPRNAGGVGNSAAAAPAVDPILQSVATVHPKIKHQLAVMASALQVAKGFISRGNMDGAYRAIGSHSDPALAAMLLEALQYRQDAFELSTVEPVIKLLELLLTSGHPQHTSIALNVLGCVLRGPGQVMRTTLNAPGGIGCDLNFEQRRTKATLAKLALQGLQLRLGVLTRSGGSSGVQAQQLVAEIAQL